MDYFNHNTFASHYKTAEFLFENAKKDNEGQFYNLISCISFCAFSLEAYLNHQGFIEQEIEWKEWDKKEHPCIKIKIKRLSKLLNFNVDFNKDEFKIINPLFKFRDSIVHGRSEQVSKEVKKPQNNTRGAMVDLSSQIDKYCTIKNAEMILRNTRIIIEKFNEHSNNKIAISRLFSLGNGCFRVQKT